MKTITSILSKKLSKAVIKGFIPLEPTLRLIDFATYLDKLSTVTPTKYTISKSEEYLTDGAIDKSLVIKFRYGNHVTLYFYTKPDSNLNITFYLFSKQTYTLYHSDLADPAKLQKFEEFFLNMIKNL